MTQIFTVAMVAAMPYPMAKASSIRVGNIVRALVGNYEDVRVKVFAYRGTADVPVHPRVDLHLVGGFDANKQRYYSWVNKLVADFKLIRAMLRHRREIHIVHGHTIEGLGIGLAFKWLGRSRAPLCIDAHGPIVPELVHYRLIPDFPPIVAAFAALERFMLRRTRHIFVSNEGLSDLLKKRSGRDHVSVVFDYVDLEVFAADHIDTARVEQLKRRYKAGGERHIVFLGMFKDYQGVDYLLNAFAVLARAHPEAHLLLVGDGPCRAQYENIIRTSGLGDRVIMTGLVPHRDVVNWLELADVVVSPRIDNEITRAGFVSQMPEYMAMGKLAVSTWVSGCGHLLRDGAGILVEPNNVEALRLGLEYALALSPEAARGHIERARANVMQFTWKQGIAEVYRIYRALLASGGEKRLAAHAHRHRDAT